MELRKLPAILPVLVNRTESKPWKGLYKFNHLNETTVVVQIDRGCRMFRFLCAKPFVSPLRIHSHTPGNVCSGEPHA